MCQHFLRFHIILVSEKQEEKIDPILQWVESEFGFKPVVYSSFFGGKQEEGLTKEIETLLKKTNDCQLASIDAMAAAAHSLIIPLAIFRGRLGIEEAIELIRLEEDHQVCMITWIFFGFVSSFVCLALFSCKLQFTIIYIALHICCLLQLNEGSFLVYFANDTN